MKSMIGFVLFLIGCAGIDGSEWVISAAIFFIGLIILWLESKKIDVSHRPK